MLVNKLLKKSAGIFWGALLAAVIVGCGENSAVKYNTTNSVINEAAEKNVSVHEKSSDVEDSSIDIKGAKLVTEGKLTVGMVIDYPPFEYYPQNSSQPIGIDVDISDAVAKQLGLTLEIKDVPWNDELFTNMGSEYDIVCSAISVTDDRMDEMLFSDSYIDSCQAVVVRKESDISISSFEALSELRVAVQRDTVSDEILHSYIEEEKINIILTETDVATECFDLLKAKAVDAVVCDSTVAAGQVERNSDIFEEAYRDESNVEKFAIAIGKDNVKLQSAINAALDVLHNNGTDKKIISSWFSR